MFSKSRTYTGEMVWSTLRTDSNLEPQLSGRDSQGSVSKIDNGREVEHRPSCDKVSRERLFSHSRQSFIKKAVLLAIADYAYEALRPTQSCVLIRRCLLQAVRAEEGSGDK